MKAKKNTSIATTVPPASQEKVAKETASVFPAGFNTYHERILGHDVKIERADVESPWTTTLDESVICFNSKTGTRERVDPELVELDDEDHLVVIKNAGARAAIIEALDFYVSEGKVEARTWIAKLNKLGVV